MSNPGAASTVTSAYVGGGGALAKIGNTTTDVISFYGVTGAAQAAKITAVATTASSSTTNAFGYTTSTQADAIVTAVNSLITACTNVGLLSAT